MSAVLRETVISEISRHSKYEMYLPPQIATGGHVPIVDELRTITDLWIAHNKLENVTARMRDTTQAYIFDAVTARDRIESSRVFIRRDKDPKDPKAVILLSRGPKHIRLHINTVNTTDALAILFEAQYLLEPGNEEFRFTIPVPSRKYKEWLIIQRLNKLGWEQESKGQVISVVVWDDIKAFQRHTMPAGYTVDKIQPEKGDVAKQLYDTNYRYHSFHRHSLREGRHYGVFNRSNKLVAVAAYDLVIPPHETDAPNIGILQDLVVDKEYTGIGIGKGIISVVVAEAQKNGAETLMADSFETFENMAVKYLKGKVMFYKYWGAFKKASPHSSED